MRDFKEDAVVFMKSLGQIVSIQCKLGRLYIVFQCLSCNECDVHCMLTDSVAY
jgi:hypothetical protein